MDTNPYAAPQANLIPDTEARQAELVRREHINHEASIRSIGVLYYLMAAMFALTGVGMLASESIGGFEMAMGLFLALLAVVFIFVGRAIRRLDRRCRRPVIVLGVVGLLNIPLGTLINAYLLYLLLAKKGKTIFSEDYAAVIAATPDVKYKTSIVVWVFVVLLVAMLLAVLVPVIYRP